MWGRKRRSVRLGQGCCEGGRRAPLGWDLSLALHALLISLTPAGEASARRGAGGEAGDLGSRGPVACPNTAPSGSWRLWPGRPAFCSLWPEGQLRPPAPASRQGARGMVAGEGT